MKKHMKKLAAVMISAGLLCSHAHASGIPVVDAAAVAQAVQQGLQLAQQINNQLDQIEEMKKQLSAIQGSRGMGDLARGAINYDFNLPSEWGDLYKLTGQDRLKGTQFNAKKADDLLNSHLDQLSKFMADNQKRLNVVESLINQINATTDIKASSDLRNRLAAEQMKFQNQQTMLDQMARMYDLQEKVHARQYGARSACLAKHMADRNYSACQ